MDREMEYIDSFYDQPNEAFFHGAFVFATNEKVLLIERGGNIVLLKHELYRQIKRRQIDENLLIKLLQRGFFSLTNGATITNSTNAAQFLKSNISPTFFMVDITNRCNMACHYCLREEAYSNSPKTIRKEKAIEICNYIARVCQEYSIDNVMVQPWGGEPLLEKEIIFLMQEQLKNCGVHAQFTIETNGLLLTNSCIEELYQKQITVSVSIDGYKKIHDAQRVLLGGKPSHAIVEDALKRLQKVYGDNVAIIATITKQSAPYVEGILDYFTKQLKLRNIKLNFVHPSSFHDNSSMCMTADEIQTCSIRILNKIIQLQKEGILVFDYNIWVKTMNLLTNQKLDVCISKGCNGGRSMITFDTEGNIYPCDVTDFPEECLGNINDDVVLDEMIKRAIQTKTYFKEKHSEKCDMCPWWAFCRGGCTVHTKCAGKMAGEIDDIECGINRGVYPELVKLIMKEPETINTLVDSRILSLQGGE